MYHAFWYFAVGTDYVCADSTIVLTWFSMDMWHEGKYTAYMGIKKSPTKKLSRAKKPTPVKHAGHRRLWKWLAYIAGIIALIALLIYIAFQVSPWPKAMFIRYEFEKGGAKTSQALEKHVPAGITSLDNQPYQPESKDGYLDVFYPEKVSGALPTVVWVHGGAWVSGDKNNVDNYLKILASYGYTTVGVDYSIAPEHQYPTPIKQLNTALDYIQKNAERLHIDAENIVLAGDSAGSQIVSQMANMVTSDSYAKEIGITPTLPASKLKGVLLNCGAYDLALPDYNGPAGDFLHTVLWAYSGTSDFLNDPKLKTASVANYLTKEFPPAFITAGNADPLESQSLELAKKLENLGVQTSTLFYPDNHQPTLQHEYQFNLDSNDGQQALKRMTDFLRTVVPPAA